MKRNIEDVLSDYSMLTYYDEKRDENGGLIFCNGHSFNKVDVDTVTKFIVLTNNKDPSNMCMLNPNLKFEIISLKYAIDKIVFQSGKGKIIFFCKKIKKN